MTNWKKVRHSFITINGKEVLLEIRYNKDGSVSVRNVPIFVEIEK